MLVIEQAKDPFVPLDDSESPSKIHLRQHTTQPYLNLNLDFEELVESCAPKIVN